MFCMKCGTKLPDEAIFCFKCGAKLPKMEDDIVAGNNINSAENEAVTKATPEVKTVPGTQSGDESDNGSIDTKLKQEKTDVIKSGAESGYKESIDNESGKNSLNVIAPVNTGVPAVEDGAKYLILSKYKIHYNSEMQKYNKLRAPFYALTQELLLRYEHNYYRDVLEGESEDLDLVLENLKPVCDTYCDELIDLGLKVLLQHNIDYISKDQLWEKMSSYVNDSELVNILSQERKNISDYRDALEYEHENRPRVQGMGFGITGYIEAQAKAAAINATTDLAKGAFNVLTGNTISGKVNDLKSSYLQQVNHRRLGHDYIWGFGWTSLFYVIQDILAEKRLVPSVSFDRNVVGRLKNTTSFYEQRQYTTEKAVNVLCECAQVTSTHRDYCYTKIAEWEPDSINEIVDIARQDGLDKAFLVTLREDHAAEKRRRFSSVTGKDYSGIDMTYYVDSQRDLDCLMYIYDKPEYFRIYDDDDEKTLIINLLDGIYSIPLNRPMIYQGVGNNVTINVTNQEYKDLEAEGIQIRNAKLETHFAETREETSNKYYQEGMRILEKRALDGENTNVADALLCFEEAGKLKHADSLCQAGLIYFMVRGEESCSDPYKAEVLGVDRLTKAAELGNVDAAMTIGEHYEIKKDTANALKFYRIAAELGNIEAPYKTGLIYKNELIPNLTEAQKYFEIGMKAGNEKAEQEFEEVTNTLKDPDKLYLIAEDLDKKYEEALKNDNSRWRSLIGNRKAIIDYYQMAYDLGNTKGSEKIGAFYVKEAEAVIGMGILTSGEEYRKAKDLYEKGVAVNYAPAMIAIGTLFENGRGVDKSFTSAEEWYKKAEDLGSEEVKKYLGDLYQAQAKLCRKQNNLADSERFGLLAAEYGNSDARDNLAKIYYEQGEQWNISNPEKAIDFYQKAADFGSADAKQKLIPLYNNKAQDHEKNNRWQEARNFYEKAAACGDAVSMLKVGTFYESGRGIEQDYKQAEIWYQKSIDAGNKDAIDRMSDLYIIYGDRCSGGNGVDIDEEKAIEYYTKAYNMHNLKANTRLGTIYDRRGDENIAINHFNEAVFNYERAGNYGNAASLTKLGDLFGNSSSDNYNYVTSLSWYRKAVKHGNVKALDNISKLKRTADIGTKLNYFIKLNEFKYKKTNYYIYPNVSEKVAREAVDTYARGVNVNNIAIMLDISEGKILGFSFGKKKPKKGFIITFNGELYTSAGNIIRLNTISGLEIRDKSIVALPSNVLVTELKDVPNEIDACFVQEFNDVIYNYTEDSHENYLPVFNATNNFYKKFGSGSCYYMVPDIPGDKLTNVMNSYAKWYAIKSEDVLFLIDTTTFGNAKDGCIVTDKQIISSLGTVTDIFKTRSFSIEKGKAILVNGQKLFNSTKSTERDEMFVSVMNEVIHHNSSNISNRPIISEYNEPEPEIATTSDQNTEECPNCGKTIEIGSIFCSYCGSKLTKCPNCNMTVEANSLFCSQCGSRIR